MTPPVWNQRPRRSWTSVRSSAFGALFPSRRETFRPILRGVVDLPRPRPERAHDEPENERSDHPAIPYLVAVLVFGIWLAIDADGYEVWDGWVIAALVLWFVMGAFGSRTGKIYNAARDRAKSLAREGNNAPNAELRTLVQDRRGLWFHTGGVIVVLLLLIDMIFKPGA